MTRARRDQVCLEATPYYHVINRCVRRAFLCGKDNVTGRSFEHRRQWIVDRLIYLSNVFAIDLCAYAVLSNHYHIVIRIDAERVASWTDTEVAERWCQLFRGPLLAHQYLAGETLSEAEWQALREMIVTWRKRLGDLSWYMRCLNEPIARMANAEDGCTGRFWQGRPKTQALLDEAALVTCMMYVDLNPVRAGIAKTPEHSDYTSIQARIQHQDGLPYLLPFQSSQQTSTTTPTIPFHYIDYLRLIDWTGRAIRDDKRGAIPDDLAPILTRLGMDEGEWVNTVTYYGRRFQRVMGAIDKLRRFSQRLKQRWVCGMQMCQRAYRTSME